MYSFSNYNSIFELLGGISSALAGINELRRFVIAQLKKLFKKGLQEAIEQCNKCEEKHKIGKNNLSRNTESYTEDQISSLNILISDLSVEVIESREIRRKLNLKFEYAILNKIAIALFVYSSLYCFAFLLVSAYNSDNILTLDESILFMSNMMFFAPIFQVVVAVFTTYHPRLPVAISLIGFFLSFMSSYYNCYSFHLGWRAFEYIVFMRLCIAFTLLPIVMMILRGWVWGMVSLSKCKKDLKKIKDSNTHTRLLALQFSGRNP